MSFELARAVKAASGFIFDMDGTIAMGDAASGGHVALPHAIQTMNAVRASGIPFRVFTNGTAKAPADYASTLRAAGFDVTDEEMMTPSVSAAHWLKRQGIGRVRVLGTEGCAAPLRALGIEVIGPAEPGTGVEAVYTGWHKAFTFPDLEAACNDVWAGARLVTASHVPFFATASGRAIGASFAINVMIGSLTEKRAKVLGKPARTAFDTACDAMGILPKDRLRVIVVGDDPALEMRMARAAGAIGIAVTTGMLDQATAAKLPLNQQPHALLETLAPLRAALSHGD